MSTETRFVGSIPALYDRHLGPVLFEPYALDLAARVPAGTRRILEVAAGTGRVTRHLLSALAADGTLVATDLNEPMLAEAASQLSSDARVRWQAADVQALPFDDASFDVVACQFGLMFVPDKPRALRELRRVLRPGGTLLLNTWNDLARNPASALLHQLAFAELPNNPPAFMLVPFSMPDATELRTLTSTAGFTQVRVDTVDKIADAVSAGDLAIGLVRGNPLYNQLVERAIDADTFQTRVTDALRAAFGDAPCRSPLSAHVVTAR
ncbi:MAG TPA: L-histidine N(alpha)-methyltransferase [Kofleriaceae bacterium]|nr:L-histidine N(alpha)-methyltransferase [Kofleriaceae bacterium]